MGERKHNFRITYNSPVVLGFSVICVFALFLSNITNGRSDLLLFSVYRSSLLNPLTYVRFIGHIFGHAGWDHLLGNIMMLLVIGPLLEEKHGSSDILFVIIVTALATGIINVIFFPDIMLMGASGVVFAFILLASMTSLRVGEIPLTFILVAVIYIGQQVYDGIFVQDDVSNLTHIIGGVVGSGLGYLMNRKEYEY